MGILNVTPDSFFDGGKFLKVSDALKQAEEMIKNGADIVDVGGESTRPGSLSVSAEEEIKRILPVIKKLRAKNNKIIISVDTNKSEVAEEALKAGANIINSLGGFTYDKAMAKVVAKYKVPIIIYHIKGEPRTMQKGEIKYKNVISEINKFFAEQIKFGLKNGVKKEQFILDPGIGFGKSVEHNLTIIREFKKFTKWGMPLLVGVSRKSHLGKVLQEKLNLKEVPGPSERLEAGLAETAFAVLNGANIVRTHDVLENKKFLVLLDELK